MLATCKRRRAFIRSVAVGFGSLSICCSIDRRAVCLSAMEISRLAQTDADEMSDSILVQPDARRTHSTGKLLGTMAASLLVGAWAGSHFALTPGQPAVSSSGDLQELAQIIAKPERGQCSHFNEDCFDTGCCDIVGYTCYQTKP